MLKVLSFLTKREDIETQAFIDYYEDHHVPLVLSLAAPPAVYKRNYLVRGDEFNREDDTIDFDVVTELISPDSGRLCRLDRKAIRRGDRYGRAEVSRSVADHGLCHRGARDSRVSRIATSLRLLGPRALAMRETHASLTTLTAPPRSP